MSTLTPDGLTMEGIKSLVRAQSFFFVTLILWKYND